MATNKPVKVDPAALTPWERSFFAFPLFHRLNREFDEVFNRLGLEKPFFENMPAMWTPELETLATDNTFVVKVDVPGLKERASNCASVRFPDPATRTDRSPPATRSTVILPDPPTPTPFSAGSVTTIRTLPG